MINYQTYISCDHDFGNRANIHHPHHHHHPIAIINIRLMARPHPHHPHHRRPHRPHHHIIINSICQ
jgi:hypothetical protein